MITITLKNELMFPEMIKIATILFERGYECVEYFLDKSLEGRDDFIHFIGDEQDIIISTTYFKIKGCTPQEGLKLFEGLGLE